MAIYGIAFFLFLKFWDDLPKGLRSVSYTFLEYSVFALLFFLNIKGKKIRISILLLSLAFILFLISYYFLVKVKRLDTIPVGIESILIFVYIFLFFYEHFNDTKAEYIYNHPCFWITVGLLIYLGGSFFINILANHLTNEEFADYWYLNYIADTLKNILFVVSMIIFSRRPNEKQTTKSIPYLDLTI